MKKFVSIAAIIAAVSFAPTGAFAHSWRHHHHHHQDIEILATVGIGAGAGAVIAGPVGAVVGGVAGLFLVAVTHDNNNY